MISVRRKPYCKLTGEVRFWRKVNKDGPVHPSLGTPCWTWTGYRFDDGYGGIMVNREYWRAHRYSWALRTGKHPADLQVLHHCDNPVCVNPDHLFLGTSKDNKLDCMGKGRHIHGKRQWCAKLNDEQVREIRVAYVFGKRGKGAMALARKYGVSKPVILGIVNRRGWKHVS